MNYGEIIQAWKEDTRWIDGRINPYVQKDVASILPNPMSHGDIIARFVIIDKTYFAERQELTFQREMHFCTSHANGNKTERDAEAQQLQQELCQFLQNAIDERQQEIDSYRNQGVSVLTTNPYGW